MPHGEELRPPPRLPLRPPRDPPPSGAAPPPSPWVRDADQAGGRAARARRPSSMCQQPPLRGSLTQAMPGRHGRQAGPGVRLGGTEGNAVAAPTASGPQLLHGEAPQSWDPPPRDPWAVGRSGEHARCSVTLWVPALLPPMPPLGFPESLSGHEEHRGEGAGHPNSHPSTHTPVLRAPSPCSPSLRRTECYCSFVSS